MSYAIGDIIYGINLTDDDDREILSDFDEDDVEAFIENHCQTSYSGNGESPVYFGIDMGSLDECSNERGSAVVSYFTVTEEHKAKYEEMLKNFLEDDEYSQEFRDAIKNATPDTWLLWGSS